MTTPIKNFFVQSFLAYKALSWSGPTPYVWNQLVRPILFVVMFALLGRFASNPEAAERFIVGMTAVAVPATVLQGILPMVTFERIGKTLPALFATAGSRAAIFWSRGTIHFLNGLMSLVVTLAFAGVFLGLDFGRVNWGLLGASGFTIAASSTAFALAASNLALVLRSWTNLSGLLQGMVVALTGAIIPVASLPWLLQWPGEVLPMTNGLVAFRAAFAGGGFGPVADSLLLELGVALVYGVAGTALFGLFEREASRRGTLDWEAV